MNIADLDVYKLAEELSDKLWHAFDKWPEKVQRTIGYQVIRSADSIAANLAEGYGRYSESGWGIVSSDVPALAAETDVSRL